MHDDAWSDDEWREHYDWLDAVTSPPDRDPTVIHVECPWCSGDLRTNENTGVTRCTECPCRPYLDT
jgi:hypothetical protein